MWEAAASMPVVLGARHESPWVQQSVHILLQICFVIRDQIVDFSFITKCYCFNVCWNVTDLGQWSKDC